MSRESGEPEKIHISRRSRVHRAATVHEVHPSATTECDGTHADEWIGRREHPTLRPGESIQRAEIAQRDEQGVVCRDGAAENQVRVRITTPSHLSGWVEREQSLTRFDECRSVVADAEAGR